MNSKLLKGLGILVTILGAGVSVLGSIVDDKKMDEKVNKAVRDVIADMNKSE